MSMLRRVSRRFERFCAAKWIPTVFPSKHCVSRHPLCLPARATLQETGNQVCIFTKVASLSYNHFSQGAKMVDILHDVQVLEHSIAHFLSTLVNLEQLDAVSAEDKFSWLVTHTLAHTSMIQLHRSFASDDVVSFEKCAQAARSCIIIIKQLADQDFAFLDPIIGVSFCRSFEFFFF